MRTRGRTALREMFVLARRAAATVLTLDARLRTLLTRMKVPVVRI